MAPRRKGYQLNIDVPTSVGPQPTTWTEPTTPEIKRNTWTSPSAGVSRNYGSTPAYVDTVPHRWTVPQPGKFFDTLNKVGQTTGKLRQQKINNAPSPFSAPPSGPPATGPTVPSGPPSYPAPTGTGMAVPSAPVSVRKASPAPAPFSTPPVTGTGQPVPPSPTGKQAKQIIKDTNPMDVPPMPEFGGDFLTTSAREAPDEPFESGVEWKDEPENPFPKGGREDFDTSRMFDPTYKPAQERTTKPAGSRTQKRKPKTT